MGRFARGLRDDGEPESAPRAEGRKSSRRKERGRGASPFRITSAGNADRIRVFWHFGFKIEKGLQLWRKEGKRSRSEDKVRIYRLVSGVTDKLKRNTWCLEK